MIVNDNITLDCDGHRIYGGEEDGVVLEGRTGVTVKNCLFEGFGVATLLSESHGNAIKNNTASHPIEGGHGISLFYSDNNTYTGNGAESTGGGTGFHVLGSSDNRIADNIVEGYWLGFTVESGPWVEVYHGSDNNQFKGNQLRNNGLIGFFLAKADGNQFSENLIRNSIVGIGLGQGAAETPEATNNTFTENIIRDNQVGYANWFNTTGNFVGENHFCHNDDHIDGTVDTETIFEENKFCGPDK